MSDFLLSALPGLMAKYEYAHDLLTWAEQWHSGLKAHTSTVKYPTMEPLLLNSIEKVAHELGSVPLLKFSIELKRINTRLENLDPHNHGAVIDNFFDLQTEIPKLERELRSRLEKYALKAIACFVVLLALILAGAVVFWR